MTHTFLAAFAAVTAFLPLYSALPVVHNGFSEKPIAEPIKLRPISFNRWESLTGLRRRDSGRFSDLNFQTQSELIYGSPGSKLISPYSGHRG